MLDAGAGCQDRQAEVVLPVHSAQRVGLGCHRASRAGGCKLAAGRTAQAADPGQSQRVFLCARPHRWQAAVSQAVRQKSQLGEWDRAGRPPVLQSELGHVRGQQGLPFAEGATNWFSTSYQSRDRVVLRSDDGKCSIFTKRPVEWKAGRGYLGGNVRTTRRASRGRRCCALSTSRRARLPGSCRRSAGRLVGRNAGDRQRAGILWRRQRNVEAVDAAHGKPLWQFQTNQLWKASPMTYIFDGKQYIAVASGSSIIAFAVPRYGRRTAVDISLGIRYNGYPTMKEDLRAFLPLSPATLHILLSLRSRAAAWIRDHAGSGPPV